MGIVNNVLAGASGNQGYFLSRSLRFRASASAYLSRTNSSSPTNAKIGSLSMWVKRGSLDTGNSQYLMETGTGTSNNTHYQLFFDTSNNLNSGQYSETPFTNTSVVFRDPASWYHLFIAYDSTQATASNRFKLYINNQLLTSSTTISQNNEWAILQAGQLLNIGRHTSVGRHFDGYITELNLIDGQALTPSSFGQTSPSTGVWEPKKYTGTYGTNGFYLPFTDNSAATATTIGKDFSGNGNNWTPNNISVTAGATYDSMTDVPTLTSATAANYCVLNPLDSLGGSVTNGNLQYSGLFTTGGLSQNGHACRSTLKVPSSGKWYSEAANITAAGSGNSCMLGFSSSTQAISVTAFGGTATPWIGVDASVFNNIIRFNSYGVSGSLANSTTLFATYASGDIVNIAIDFTAGKIWIGKNGTWYNSGNPANGTNETSTFTAGTAEWAFWAEYVAASNDSNRSSASVNFGQQPFAYTPPSGFVALNTFNLPTPTIGATASSQANKYFDAVTFNNQGGSYPKTVTGLNFQPDFVWIKSRTQAYPHYLFDSVRGTGIKSLSSNSTAAEGADGVTNLSSFNSNGFTAAAGDGIGDIVGVYWSWRANQGTNVTNTAGTITATVSANTTAGFSIVAYTGNGTNGATVGHGLGVKPKLIIEKGRTSAYNWSVQGCGELWTPATSTLFLNTSNALNASGAIAAPTSTVFTPSAVAYANESGVTNIAYVFAEVAGYSQFGSYTGNGSTDGPFVFCGFRPRWIMFKRTDTAANWYIFDTARNTVNVMDNALYPNLANAEAASSSYYMDYLSNGFKQRNTFAEFNAIGGTYIYAAFAESPFKYSLAR